MTKQKEAKGAWCPWRKWGNSVIASNFKFWECSYCGKLIQDGVPFQMMRIGKISEPFIFDTEHCMVLMIQKLDKGA